MSTWTSASNALGSAHRARTPGTTFAQGRSDGLQSEGQ